MDDQLRDVALLQREQATLELLIARIVRAVWQAAAALEPAGRVCQLALLQAQPDEEWQFEFPELAARTADAREREITGVSGTAKFDAAWTGGRHWECNADVNMWEPDDASVRERSRQLYDVVFEAGVLDVLRWVLCRGARAVSDLVLPWPVTPDFVVYVFDEEMGSGGLLADAVAFSAPPEVRELLRAAQLLPRGFFRDLDAPLSDEQLEQVTARIESRLNDEWEPTGLWSAWCHVEGAEEGQCDVPLEEALSWARQFTDVIRISHFEPEAGGDRLYTAGKRPIPGLPEWPRQQEMR